MDNPPIEENQPPMTMETTPMDVEEVTPGPVDVEGYGDDEEQQMAGDEPKFDDEENGGVSAKAPAPPPIADDEEEAMAPRKSSSSAPSKMKGSSAASAANGSKAAAKSTTSPTSSSSTAKRKSSKKGKKKPSKREMNPKFKDVKESGSWGNISKTEKIAVIAIFSILVIGAIVACAVILTRDTTQEVITAPKATESPTSAPTDVSPDKLLNTLLDDIYNDEFAFGIADAVPLKATDYVGLIDDPAATPQEKAIAWVLYEDEYEESADALERFAMASIYYQMGGPTSWIKKQEWLTANPLCDWEGILCEPITGNIRELDLQLNGLVGTIPSELHLFPTLQSILLQRNEITGTIPGPMLGDLPRLGILYLDTNKLSGTVPASLLDSGTLNSLFVQFNDLTGEWPLDFCPVLNGDERPIKNIGLDCDELLCACCDGKYDCYNDLDSENEQP